MGSFWEPKTLIIIVIVAIGVGLISVVGGNAGSLPAGSEILIVALVAYLLPSAVAFSRDNRQKVPILALNVLLGWTLVGWVVALVWALARSPDANLLVPTVPSAGAELERLAALRDGGVLSEEEFADQKAKILAR